MSKIIITITFLCILIVSSSLTVIAAQQFGNRIGREKKTIAMGSDCKVINNEDNRNYFIPTKSKQEWDKFLEATGEIQSLSIQSCSKPLKAGCGNQWIPLALDRKGKNDGDFLAQVPDSAREILITSKNSLVYANQMWTEGRYPYAYYENSAFKFFTTKPVWIPFDPKKKVAKTSPYTQYFSFDQILGYRDTSCGDVLHCGATWIPLSQPARFAISTTSDLKGEGLLPSSIPSQAVEVLIAPTTPVTFTRSVYGNRQSTNAYGALMEISTAQGTKKYTKSFGSNYPTSMWLPMTSNRKISLEAIPFLHTPWKHVMYDQKFEVLGYRTADSCTADCTSLQVVPKIVEVKTSSLTEEHATFTLPSSIPETAKEVLFQMGPQYLYYNYGVEYIKEPSRLILYAQQGDKRYAKKIYGTVPFLEYPKPKNKYYTEAVWLPVTSERKIHLVPENGKLKKSLITIIGYRNGCGR